MDVVALAAAQVGVRIGGLHDVDGGHESCTLVDRIAVGDDVLHGGAELDVTALFQPFGDTSVIEVAGGQSLVLHEQRYQLLHVVGDEVALGVDDEAAVLQQR